AIGMRVVACDSFVSESDPAWRELGVERCTLEAVLSESDVVSLHLPLLPETRGLLDGARLARMKRDAILVNAARGGIVEGAALGRTLHDGRLGGAAFDVSEAEPLPAGSALAGAPRLLLTPHIAGVTAESNERVSALIADRVAEALR